MDLADNAIEIHQKLDLGWIFKVGIRHFVPAGTTLVSEGVQPESMYLVLAGELSVTVAGMHDTRLAKLGPGELVGEMAFLEGSGATATIVAERDTVVLSVDYSQVEQILEADPSFAAQLYRAFALIAERRLRRRVGSLVAVRQIRNSATVAAAMQ